MCGFSFSGGILVPRERLWTVWLTERKSVLGFCVLLSDESLDIQDHLEGRDSIRTDNIIPPYEKHIIAACLPYERTVLPLHPQVIKDDAKVYKEAALRTLVKNQPRIKALCEHSLNKDLECNKWKPVMESSRYSPLILLTYNLSFL